MRATHRSARGCFTIAAAFAGSNCVEGGVACFLSPPPASAIAATTTTATTAAPTVSGTRRRENELRDVRRCPVALVAATDDGAPPARCRRGGRGTDRESRDRGRCEPHRAQVTVGAFFGDRREEHHGMGYRAIGSFAIARATTSATCRLPPGSAGTGAFTCSAARASSSLEHDRAARRRATRTARSRRSTRRCGHRRALRSRLRNHVPGRCG